MKKAAVKIFLLLLVLSAFTGALTACGDGDENERKSKIYYQYFDTVTTLYDFSGGEESVFSENAAAFEAEISACHELFDIYNSYSGIANIKSINDAAGKEPVKVDGRIIKLLLFSKEMYEKTDGKVNVAMGAVLKIWHTYREGAVSIPTEEELISAAEHCDINNVEIDREAGTVRLADPLMSLDVGAVAKGFAIDLAVELLRSRGAVSYAVDIGGNLYGIGAKPDGSPYKTGIQNPDGGDYSAYIDINDGAVATSGDYQRYYTVDGKIYHHIINGETLYPSNFHRSVSVYSDSAALSDALSTALFNTKDYAAARAIISGIEGVRELVFVEADGHVEKITA